MVIQPNPVINTSPLTSPPPSNGEPRRRRQWMTWQALFFYVRLIQFSKRKYERSMLFYSLLSIAQHTLIALLSCIATIAGKHEDH
uniref:Uncharacterized protein n=1 Tax=Plectus sambesii TaxID=2011161 RepID=A0A914XNN1_9BILA